MKKTYYIHQYKIGRDKYSHFYVCPLRSVKITGRLELIKRLLATVKSKYYWRVDTNPTPKLPSAKK